MGNKTSEDTLFKPRSSGASIKAGFHLYTANFKKIFKSSWGMALIYAAFFSALSTISVIELPRVQMQIMADITQAHAYRGTYQTLLVAIIAILILGGIAEVVFYSRGLSLLAGHQREGSIPSPTKWLTFDLHTAWRTIKAAVCCFAVTLLPALAFALFFHLKLRFMLTAPEAHTMTLALTAIAMLVVALLLLPLGFVALKYILSDGLRNIPPLTSLYATGLRHMGALFAVGIVCAIIISIAGFIILLPANILIIANYQANLGMAYGDPLGMPEHITALTALTFLIAGFFQAYIRMSALFPAYYVYGSIEMQEKGRAGKGNGQGMQDNTPEKKPSGKEDSL